LGAWIACALACLTPARPAGALNPAKPLREFGRQSWQTESGLPQNTVHAVLQTRDGFLWIATEGGLVRFDGQDQITFDSSNTPELHSNLINDLADDATGALWIATADGLLRLTSGARAPVFTRFTTSNGLPADNVRTLHHLPDRSGDLLLLTSGGAALLRSGHLMPLAGVAADLPAALLTDAPNGAVWIANSQQIVALSTGANTVTPLFPASQIPAEIGTLQAIAVTPKGELWIGGHTGLALLSNSRRAVTLHPVPTVSVTALAPGANGALWVGTENGLQQVTNNTLRPIPTEPAAGRVLQFYSDRAGALWVAFETGLTRLPPSTSAAPHGLPPLLPLPGVRAAFEDREGDMWFGTDTSGLTVLREQAFSTLTAADGLSDDLVRAVFQDHTGTLWIGSNRGLDSLRNDRVAAFPALAGTVVLALAETNAATGHPALWVGTPDGLTRIEDGRLTRFTTANGLPDDFVRSLYTDTDGTLWIGTRNGLAHLVRGTFTSYSRLDGLGSDVIGAILRSRSGALWVGTLGGLSRLTRSRFRTYTRQNGLSGDAITALHEDQQGSLWIAAHAAGLTRLQRGVFTPVHPPQGALPDEIFSILEDTEGNNLWLGSSHGIHRVSLEALDALVDRRSTTLPVAVFGTADGLKISECSSGGHPAAWRMQNGSLWFSTLKGVSSIKPGDGLETPVPPMVAIEQILIDSKDGDKPAPEDLVIPPGTERLTIHYAGLSFAAPQKTHFRYKLEGFDHDWVDAGTRRTAYYTNLPPGSYRFLIYAANNAYTAANSGVWSLAPATLSLTLEPHYYQTLWFRCCLAVMLLLLGYCIYRWRLQIVAARYQAVLEERTRIAREIHDTLAQGYVGVSVQLEVLSRLLRASPERAAGQLEVTKELVRSSLAEARCSIWNLRSPEADNGNASNTLPLRLAAAIEARRHGDGPALRLEVQGASRILDHRLEDEFLRVAQEAVTNSIRHACARQVSVTLRYENDSLRAQIADDGIGFDPPPEGFTATGHFGLKGMEERAASIGARLQVHSQLGRGTTVILTCALPAAQPSRLDKQRSRDNTSITQPLPAMNKMEKKEAS
jgi:ligand-binding sensor domain-containing protein/signal transduction histidine kinase